MNPVPFVLEERLAKYRDSVPHQLGMSTGPKWTLAGVAALMADAERAAFDSAALTYCASDGGAGLREALASMYGADPEEILCFNGGAESLLALFAVIDDPGANVVVPVPSFASFIELPAALGIETRRYALTIADGFALGVDAIFRFTDARTRLILVNTPHNPSSAARGSSAATCSAPCAARGPTRVGEAGGATSRRITATCSC